MIMLPYVFCDDKKANLLIEKNINRLIAKMAEHQMDTACSYRGIPGYKDLDSPVYLSAFYSQISSFFPRWISPEDSVKQFILFYMTVQSRRFYKMYLLQEYVLAKLIKESIYLAEEILVDGDSVFRSEFSQNDRAVVGNSMAEGFVESVNLLYSLQRSKSLEEKYLKYNMIPYPEQKVKKYESIYCLFDACFSDETYSLLDANSPAQLLAEDPSHTGFIEPEMQVPDNWWARLQDICDIPGNPQGMDHNEAELHLIYPEV